MSLLNVKHETTMDLLKQLIQLKTPTTGISPQAKQMAKQIKENYEKEKNSGNSKKPLQ